MSTDERSIAIKASALCAGFAVGAIVARAALERGVDGGIRDVREFLVRVRVIVRERVVRALETTQTVSMSAPFSTAVEAEDEDVDAALVEKFHKCANQFKLLLIDADAYFEPGVKAKMYGLYKRCQCSFDTDAVRPTNPLDVVGRAKYDAWKSVRNLSRREAMESYVETFREWGERYEELLAIEKAQKRDEKGFTDADKKAAEEFHDDDNELKVFGRAWSMGGAHSQPIVPTQEEESSSDDVEALIAACRAGDEDAAVKALQNGADLNERDSHGRTPLHWCADGGHTKLAMHLCLLKADVNAQDKYGQTPLHYSVSLEDAETANLLLDWGADPSMEDAESDTPESIGLWELAGARTLEGE